VVSRSSVSRTTFRRAPAPHVVGVRTESGEELRADLVVDATGRRSPLPRWLEAAGAAPLHEEAEDSGFVYYTRYFRSRDGRRPQARERLLFAIGSISILTLPGDNDTWSVTLFASSSDRPLTRLRDPDRWTAVVTACPMQAHWLDAEPITDVLPMAGVLDRYRRVVVAGHPVVTGLAMVGDAWDEAIETELTPWYRATVAVDRARLAEMEALREGRERPRADSPAGVLGAALVRAMPHDAEIFRAFTEIAGCLTLPSAVFARPGFADRVQEVAGRHPFAPPPGPTRDELLRLIA
jgi:hypothetical protein